MIDNAEEILINKGFRDVRARHLGSAVRLEVRTDQIQRLVAETVFEEVNREMIRIGFRQVMVDSNGYLQGRMNKSI
jgi:uncharacterized protein